MQLKFVDIEEAFKFITLASKWEWLNDFYGFDNQELLVELIFLVGIFFVGVGQAQYEMGLLSEYPLPLPPLQD